MTLFSGGTVRFRNISMEFDKQLFADDVKKEVDLIRSHSDMNQGEVAVLCLGIDPSYLSMVINQNYDETFQHPSMHKYLLICNALGLDARKYFSLVTESDER